MTATQSPRGCLSSSPFPRRYASGSLALPSIGGEAGVQTRGQLGSGCIGSWHWHFSPLCLVLRDSPVVACNFGLGVFFLSLVGQAVQFVLPCLAPGSWLYVPSQVPLSLHTWSKKAPVLRREKESNAVSLLCPALPDIFLNVGQQLCELCAVRVVRPCFVWMPVHSRQVLDFCFFGCCFSD